MTHQRSGCSLEPITTRANFDRGSIGAIKEVSPGVLRGATRHWAQKNGQNDQRYWFYFQLNGVGNREVTIILTDMIGIYRGKPHRAIISASSRPVVSYDRIVWDRMDDAWWDADLGTWTLHHRFRRTPAWVAYAHPYTLEQAYRWLDELEAHPAIERTRIGLSADGRPLWLLSVGPKRPRTTVLITGLLHPGEDSSGYVLESAVSFLLGDDPRGRWLRREVLFKIVPVMNPDGLFRGHARLNANLEDLNAAWNPTQPAGAETPEIAAMQAWLSQWSSTGGKIDLHFDFHAFGQTQQTVNAVVTPDPWLQSKFVPLLGAGGFRTVKRDFPGSITLYTAARFGARSATIELSQGQMGGEWPRFVTLDDYRAVGMDFMATLYRSFTHAR